MMELFFNTNAPDFREKWKSVREKGFLRFYLHSALYWILYVFLLQTLCLLIIRHSCTWNDVLSVAAVGALFGVVLPPIQWKVYERKYQARVQRHEKKI